MEDRKILVEVTKEEFDMIMSGRLQQKEKEISEFTIPELVKSLFDRCSPENMSVKIDHILDSRSLQQREVQIAKGDLSYPRYDKDTNKTIKNELHIELISTK